MSTRRKPQPRRRVVSTGLKIEARHRHHARLPSAVPGRHLWAVFGVWALGDPTAARFELDIENLLTLEGPGCFVCEQPYTPELAAAPCSGGPWPELAERGPC